MRDLIDALLRFTYPSSRSRDLMRFSLLSAMVANTITSIATTKDNRTPSHGPGNPRDKNITTISAAAKYFMVGV